jgi:hypothetical protein
VIRRRGSRRFIKFRGVSYGERHEKVSSEKLARALIFSHSNEVNLEISTPALLFPAISLLFLSYTNRFLHLAALVRTLHGEWQRDHMESARVQIANLRKRLFLIRWMQLLGAISLLLCVISMIAILLSRASVANGTFFAAVVVMSLSLASLIVEILISGGALRILLGEMEDAGERD